MENMKEMSMEELDQVTGGNTVNTGCELKAQVRTGPEDGWKRLVSLPNGTEVSLTGRSANNASMNGRRFVEITFWLNGKFFTGWIAASIVKA